MDLKQHMVPMDTKNLIHCDAENGPTFGAGYDLCLVDNCNINNSKANFPTTYNTEGENQFINGQGSYHTFSGALNSFAFRVT